MRNLRYRLVLFFVLILFVYGASKSEKSLAEIYKSGKVRFIPVLTIDDTSMPEDIYFELVSDIKCDNAGHVYVCDVQANNIMKFDSFGRYLKTIGRQGQGPGEFNMPSKIAVTNDRLIVWDMRNRRLCAFTLDGEFIKSVSLSMGNGMPQKMKALPNGDIVIELEKINITDLNKPQDCLLEIYSFDLGRKKTVYTQQVLRNKFKILEGGGRNYVQPFSPLVSWDITPGGEIVIGFPKAYEIEIYDRIKGKISSFTHSYEPVRVTDKDKEMYFAGGRMYSGEGVMKKDPADDSAKYREWPKFKPAFMKILVDPEGNILVWPYLEKREEEWRVFHAFNPAGNFLGNVQVMGDIEIPGREILKDCSFWKQEYDEEGLVKIVKYRISDRGEI